MTIAIPLDRIHAHPENCNKLGTNELVKLRKHLADTGNYPPLIVRAHPEKEGHYELLDGHYRAHILRDLKHPDADCCIWEVDDNYARILLLTLNRLNGVDDPRLRGKLMERMAKTMTLDQLAKAIPDHKARIKRLIELNQPPDGLKSPTDPANIPNAFTFFLTKAQEKRLRAALKAFDKDPSAAIIKAFDLDKPDLP